MKTVISEIRPTCKISSTYFLSLADSRNKKQIKTRKWKGQFLERRKGVRGEEERLRDGKRG